MTPDLFDVAVAEPAGFDAVTRASSLWPASAEVSRYEERVAPVIALHDVPVDVQRSHWYA